ncbi:MAG TPA: hypothetical protein VLV87_09785, partial [Gammaproteobacteria bacterium]|nr:hypothetical protein [Gammaproteobacteria bacterium]
NQIMTTRAVDAFRALCVLRVEYVHIPDAGHANLDSRVFQRAVKFLDAPTEPSASDLARCEQRLGNQRPPG